VGGQRQPEKHAACLCRDCHHFLDSGLEIEAELPGLTILSSAFGDAMGDQGLCRVHERLVPPRHSCPDFEGSE